MCSPGGSVVEAKYHQSDYFEAFELLHGWGGLLVEANPLHFSSLDSSGRRAWKVVLVLIMQSSDDIVSKADICLISDKSE